VKIIASIEDPEVIGRILQHLGLDRSEDCSRRLPAVRAPPDLCVRGAARSADHRAGTARHSAEVDGEPVVAGARDQLQV
jgi:hypothetical protein